MKLFCLFLIALIITLGLPFNSFSQHHVNVLNKQKMILKKNTKFLSPKRLYSNKYFKIKVNGEILIDSLKLQNSNGSVVSNYNVYVLNDNKEIVRMKYYGGAHYVYFGDESQLDFKSTLEDKVNSDFEKSLLYERSLFKHKKKYIKIRVPIRKRITSFSHSYYYGYGLDRGKYFFTMSYSSESQTYYSDTIPLFIK